MKRLACLLVLAAAAAYSQTVVAALADLQKELSSATPAEVGARVRSLCTGAEQIAACEVWALLNTKAVLGQQNHHALEVNVAILGSLRDLRRQLIPSEPENPMVLVWLGETYDLQDNVKDAEPLFLHALDLLHPQGAENILRAVALNDLASVHETKTEYPQAIGLYKQALEIRKEVFGANSPLVAESLSNLGRTYAEMGKFAEAESNNQGALAILELAAPGTRGHGVVLQALGDLKQTKAKYSEAESLYSRALAIFEKLDPASPDTAKTRDSLASVYDDEGELRKAEPLRLRAVNMIKEASGPNHSDTAYALHNLGSLYYKLGTFDKAEDNYKQALYIFETTVGPDHPDTASTMDALAQTWVVLGEYEKAEPMFLRALAIRKAKLGPKHPDTAVTLSNLGVMYVSLGDYPRAESLLKEAVDILQTALGPDHPEVAVALENESLLYFAQGAYAQAESLRRRALEIYEKTPGAAPRDVAVALNNLAELYRVSKQYAKAEPLYLQALDILEQTLPPQHLDIASALDNLGSLYMDEGKYESARPVLERSLAIRTRALGVENPDSAYVLNNLARLCFKQKDYSCAVDNYQRALEAMEKLNRPDHPDTISVRTDFARALWQAGKRGAARDQLIEANRSLSRFWPGALVAVEQNRRRSLVAKFDDLVLVSLAVAEKLVSDDPAGATRLAALAIMTRKGIQSSARQEVYARIKRESNSEGEKLLDQLSANAEHQGRAARLPSPQARIRLAQLSQDEERIEAMLIEKSDVFRQWRFAADLTQITAALPRDTALIDLLRYPAIDLASGAPASTEYVAVVYHSAAEPRVVFLGPAGVIDESVTALRRNFDNIWAKCLPEDHCSAGAAGILIRGDAFERNLHRTESDCEALFGLTIARLLPAIGNRKHLIVSPDGKLAEIPWEILREGSYLIEKGYRIRYVDSARSLAEPESKSIARSPIAVIVNVDYDGRQAPGLTRNHDDVPSGPVALPAGPAGKWNPLHGGDEILRTLSELRQQGKIGSFEKLPLGSEEEVLALRQPSAILALTHGFFAAPPTPFADGLDAGIMLYGANHANDEKRPGRDGWLMAKEVMLMHLEGTQLVALFGCDTGLGTEAGEGVQGLRHALTVAGARSTLLTLWDVGDLSSARFLDELLVRLASDSNKSLMDALSEVRLAFLSGAVRESGSTLESNRWRHPYFWAAATLSGRDTVPKLK